MDTTAKAYRNADKWSTLLRQELGYPPYSWQWSEDLIVRMRDHEHGYDHYANPATGLIELKPKWIDRGVCAPSAVKQWVLCRLITPVKRAWMAQFQDDMAWPENGRWTPCNGPGGYVALPPETEPDHARTWQVIRMVREAREETVADRREQARRQQLRKLADKEKLRMEFFESEVPKLLAAPRNTVYNFGADTSDKKEVVQ